MPTNEADQTTIVWKLPKEQKGRYVAAARRENLSLVSWLESACEARAAKNGQAEAPRLDRDDGGGLDGPGRGEG